MIYLWSCTCACTYVLFQPKYDILWVHIHIALIAFVQQLYEFRIFIERGPSMMHLENNMQGVHVNERFVYTRGWAWPLYVCMIDWLIQCSQVWRNNMCMCNFCIGRDCDDDILSPEKYYERCRGMCWHRGCHRACLVHFLTAWDSKHMRPKGNVLRVKLGKIVQ